MIESHETDAYGKSDVTLGIWTDSNVHKLHKDENDDDLKITETNNMPVITADSVVTDEPIDELVDTGDHDRPVCKIKLDSEAYNKGTAGDPVTETTTIADDSEKESDDLQGLSRNEPGLAGMLDDRTKQEDDIEDETEVKEHAEGTDKEIKLGKACHCVNCDTGVESKEEISKHKHKTHAAPHYKLTLINRQKTKHESDEFKNVKRIDYLKCDAETKHDCCTNRKLKTEKSGGRKSILKKAAHELNKCDQCDFETYHRTRMKNHIEAVHKDTKKSACRIGDYTSHHRHMLRYHMKSHHPDPRYKSLKRIDLTSCDQDKMQLKNFVLGRVTRVRRKALNLNTKINIGEEEYLLRCEECEHYAARTGSVENHIKPAHERALRYPCAFCTCASYFRKTVRHHLNSTHPSKELHIKRISHMKWETD